MDREISEANFWVALLRNKLASADEHDRAILESVIEDASETVDQDTKGN